MGCILAGALIATSLQATTLKPTDVFSLVWASDPQISSDGDSIAFVINSMDEESDKRRTRVHLIDFDGTRLRAVAPESTDSSFPRWSPDGSRLLYLETIEEEKHLVVYHPATGESHRITTLSGEPEGFSWSPSGDQIAFAMLVPIERESIAELPAPPEGSDWAKPPKVIESLIYRADGKGYLDDGYIQLFIVSAEGGKPRQLTSGSYHHFDTRTEDPGTGPAWTSDGSSLVFSANLNENWILDPLNYDLHQISVGDGEIRQLTDRQGPETHPVLSPDGTQVAYLGFDDRFQGYQLTQLSVMKLDGSGSRTISASLDRSVHNPQWSGDGSGLFVHYDSEGNGKLAFISLDGDVSTLADNLGGSALGRPYDGGDFSASGQNRFVFTISPPDHPADLAVGSLAGGPIRRITTLSSPLLDDRELATVEEIWFDSSFDGRKIQGWLAKPPGFDPASKYPLILEIHGGPFLNYGDRFAAEIQLYAAAGYVVLYVNPRGSTSYGEEFGNLIHHNYPGQDYDDLMSGVDAAIDLGFVDSNQLFVTGGSGGGVLTAWIVGKTDRFRAAVSAKPVINWYSFALTADSYNFFYRYWFPGPPWEVPEKYLARSPISLVGKVTTPTMLLTGEEDFRTPISESEQYYQALKLRQIDTALVRLPGASHSIAKRPSQLIAKVGLILGWFDRYRQDQPAGSPRTQ